MTHKYHHGDLRSALLAGAETILNAQGIGALSLRGAARAAGVSHAAPTHHFGDVSGLLSALAATGFVRLRDRLDHGVATAGLTRRARLMALGRGYIEFARGSPGLFQLMFRSERLDWSIPALAQAAEAAFALLALDEPDAEAGSPTGLQRFTLAATRWSLVHGLATLLVDGRLGPLVYKAHGDVEAVIEAVLVSLTLTQPPIVEPPWATAS